MAAALHHAMSSAKKWGGEYREFMAIHLWFDQTKEHHGDFRHRALRHHTLGIAECIQKFGDTLVLSTGRIIPIRWVAEQHVIEDCGYIPSVGDWLKEIRPQPWMTRSRKLSSELEETAGASLEAPAVMESHE